jgi:hypothetical protein
VTAHGESATAGEPTDHHRDGASADASKTKPAKLLAVFVVPSKRRLSCVKRRCD